MSFYGATCADCEHDDHANSPFDLTAAAWLIDTAPQPETGTCPDCSTCQSDALLRLTLTHGYDLEDCRAATTALQVGLPHPFLDTIWTATHPDQGPLPKPWDLPDGFPNATN